MDKLVIDKKVNRSDWDGKKYSMIEHREKQYAYIVNELYGNLSDKEKEIYPNVLKNMTNSNNNDISVKEFILLLNGISLKKYRDLLPKRESKLTDDDYNYV